MESKKFVFFPVALVKTKDVFLIFVCFDDCLFLEEFEGFLIDRLTIQ